MTTIIRMRPTCSLSHCPGTEAADRSLDEDGLRAWLDLLDLPGVGRRSLWARVADLGSPQAALQTWPAQRSLLAPGTRPAASSARWEAVMRWWRAPGRRRHIVSMQCSGYPLWLAQSADPPPLLYVEGDLQALELPSVAVVGTRKPTPQGQAHAFAFSAALSRAGLGVVSGLAQGIDAAAHRGALSAAGATVAVVATGLDRCYPKRHLELSARILAEGGACVSEYGPGTAAVKHHFPERNRIIAGLSRGTLVVEAAEHSGSLITARLANESGREVFAIPGSIHCAQYSGCHSLIRQGATLVSSVDDILAELGWTPLGHTGRLWPPAVPATAANDPPWLVALGHDPVTLDELQLRTGEALTLWSTRLLELELAGRVQRLPGGRYQRR